MAEKIVLDLYKTDAPENKEDFLVIWLNSNVNNTSISNRIRASLLKLNPAAKFYTNIRRCEILIRTTNDEKVLLVISGTYASSDEVLVRLFEIRCVRAVFIYRQNGDEKTTSSHQQKKVIGIFRNPDHLIISIEKTIHLLEKQTYTCCLFNQRQKSTRDLSKEEASFIWHQLLIHVLKQTTDDEQAKNDMLDQCKSYYRHSKNQLENIEKFRSMYLSEKAIYWYTKESFVYKLLNRAFRTENIELIYAFRYFIIDLCAQLEQKSRSLNNSDIINLYRGQQIPNEEFDKLKKSTGELISPNGFFSTSRNDKLSILYAGKSSNQMTAVLFKIQIDPSLKSVIFADIEDITAFEGEHEVLFSIGSTFRIDSIEFDSKLNLWTIQLISTNDGFERVQEYLKVADDEMKDMNPIIYFGSLLLFELGQVDYAEKYFNVLLKTLPSDHPDFASLNTGLGHVYTKRGDYYRALEHYQICYKIRQETLSILNPRIAASLRNIGNLYRLMGDFDQALIYFRQAMYINERNYSNDHVAIAMTMAEIGLIYQNKNEFETALHCFENALEIFKGIFPSRHPQIAECLGRIGYLYQSMNKYDRSLEYLHQELEMDELCLPPDHIDLINDFTRIIEIYKMTNAYDKGLQFCREKISTYQVFLGENHPRIVNTLLRTVTLLLGKHELEEALDLCKRALAIVLYIVPFDIYITIECLQYISYIYHMTEDFNDSLEYRERQLEMEKTIYLSDHPNIGWSLVHIGMTYYDMGRYTTSLERLHEALAIYVGMSPKKKVIIETIKRYITRVEIRQAMSRKLRAWSPVPLRSERSPVPLRSKKSPVPLRSGRSPVPLRSKKSPVPHRSGRSPVPLRSKKSPVPHRSGRSPVPRRLGRSLVPRRSGRSPVPLTPPRSLVQHISRPGGSTSGGSTPALSRSASNSRFYSDSDLEILKLKLSLTHISTSDTQSEIIFYGDDEN